MSYNILLGFAINLAKLNEKHFNTIFTSKMNEITKKCQYKNVLN